MIKIVTVIGNRPQFIKAALVSRQFAAMEGGVAEIAVHIHLHHDPNISGVFFEELELHPPQYDLHIGSGSHSTQTGKMLEEIEAVLMREEPDLVMIYGDTSVSLAGALAAVKLHIPVAHVEAGVRSVHLRMPEEVNRVLIDRISSFLFVPTEKEVTNLIREEFPKETIHLVGDVMHDAALYYGKKAEQNSRILKELGFKAREYVLAVIDRPKNTDDALRLKSILSGLQEVSRSIPVVLPLHPRIRTITESEEESPIGLLTQKLCESGSRQNECNKTFLLLSPVGYLDMMMLEKNARIIVTDSGEIQKEAYYYRVPCVTLMEETQWVELIESGWNQMVPPKNTAVIADAVLAGMKRCGKECQLYGKGDAAEKIVRILTEKDRRKS
ncbi:MAG: UDP-N-acetylglucosamine 2-epimerase (non-hydrolyzing) [Candidatus Aureabacteria bacterium]|nr:UDP-N-acetylglucosamine 2-epimerase (non-hydrolyzing) [Candidatus Auribacterota bacterium]